MPNLAAFVLAGGKSLRMGQDKAALVIAGKTLLERAIEIAKAASDSVSVVGSGESTTRIAQLGLTTITDVHRGQGPLAGIHAALESPYAGELNLILAVDTPFLTAAFVRYLVYRARSSKATVTAPRIDGRLHPLCAVYRRGFAECAQEALDQQRNKIEAAIDPAALNIIHEGDLAAGGFDPEMFTNINTPADLAMAQARLRS